MRIGWGGLAAPVCALFFGMPQISDMSIADKLLVQLLQCGRLAFHLCTTAADQHLMQMQSFMLSLAGMA
eukprot:2680273-Amphidinium_carterae.3